TLCWMLTSLGIVNVAWSAVYATGIPLLATHQLSGNLGAYGLIVGAYGVGNVLSLFVVGLLPFRMNMLLMFVGQLLLGGGFFMLGYASSLPMAMCWTAVAAFGSPMGDLIMLSMIQTDFQSEHIGKMYSLRQLISGLGLLVGSFLAVPIFKYISVSQGFVLFAVLILLVGLVGLMRFTGQKRVKITNLQENS
ncbi:MAG: MFS transporter, partial [Tumebacillaceae bacterium]